MTAFKPIIRDVIRWKYVGGNLGNLDREITTAIPARLTDGLVQLNQKVDIEDYNWKAWGPTRESIKWHYLSYDPPETKIWKKKEVATVK